MFQTSFEEFVRLRITPEIGPTRPYDLAPIDRSKLGMSYAQHMAEIGNVAASEAQLKIAEDLLEGRGPSTSLVLADAQIARAALMLRRQDFAGANRLLQLAQENCRDRLPVSNPRKAILETYMTIGKLGAQGAAASDFGALARYVGDKVASLGQPSAKASFTAWLQPNGNRDWAQLPLARL